MSGTAKEPYESDKAGLSALAAAGNVEAQAAAEQGGRSEGGGYGTGCSKSTCFRALRWLMR